MTHLGPLPVRLKNKTKKTEQKKPSALMWSLSNASTSPSSVLVSCTLPVALRVIAQTPFLDLQQGLWTKALLQLCWPLAS